MKKLRNERRRARRGQQKTATTTETNDVCQPTEAMDGQKFRSSHTVGGNGRRLQVPPHCKVADVVGAGRRTTATGTRSYLRTTLSRSCWLCCRSSSVSRRRQRWWRRLWWSRRSRRQWSSRRQHQSLQRSTAACSVKLFTRWTPDQLCDLSVCMCLSVLPHDPQPL